MTAFRATCALCDWSRVFPNEGARHHGFYLHYTNNHEGEK